MSTRLRLEIGEVVVAGRHDEMRAQPELRAQLTARIGAALAEADRSGLLWKPAGRGRARAVDQDVVERLVAGAVTQTFDPVEEP